MHYIRILKPPRLLPTHTPLSLSAKITITTDLGESFLLSNISLVVELELEDRTSVFSAASKGREYVWKGRDGMRSLEVLIPVTLSKGKRKLGGEMVRMLIRPKEEEFAVDSFQKVLSGHTKGDEGDEGGVVAVRSTAIDISPGAKADKAPGVGMAERVFSIGSGNDQKRVRIWEETGESIARHIWYAMDPDRDAGLFFSSYLASLSTPPSNTPSHPKILILEKLLLKKELKVLELGSGCGIVGITLASSFPHLQKALLTDLPEASEILTKNLSPATLSLHIRSKLESQVLDWSSPLPPNVAETTWDLVLVADCTYNPDVVPDLVQTLKRLAQGNDDILVALAMKVRHESEMVFFELMREKGFGVRENVRIPLPVLGGEDESIEVFVFGLEK